MLLNREDESLLRSDFYILRNILRYEFFPGELTDQADVQPSLIYT